MPVYPHGRYVAYSKQWGYVCRMGYTVNYSTDWHNASVFTSRADANKACRELSSRNQGSIHDFEIYDLAETLKVEPADEPKKAEEPPPFQIFLMTPPDGYETKLDMDEEFKVYTTENKKRQEIIEELKAKGCRVFDSRTKKEL